jgi:hypothetical protein
MIMALSISVGLLAAWLWYRVLFYDSNDFWQGCGKFMSVLTRGRGRRPARPHPPDYFEDEGWSSGFRFLLFAAASFGCGYLVYYELHKHFG